MDGSLRFGAAALAAGLTLSTPLAADGGNVRTAGATVDVALVLAVDVSASIDADERRMQREGYAAAIAAPEVMQAIGEGAHGRILLTVVEWSDSANQEIRVPWTVVSDLEDARRVAAAILVPGSRIPHSTTSVAGALRAAAVLLGETPERAERRVVDISGDGKDFEMFQVRAARAALLDDGVTVNALPILSAPDDPDVAEWYRDHVIGGPGAFVAPAIDFRDLEPALRRKLVLELT